MGVTQELTPNRSPSPGLEPVLFWFITSLDSCQSVVTQVVYPFTHGVTTFPLDPLCSVVGDEVETTRCVSRGLLESGWDESGLGREETGDPRPDTVSETRISERSKEIREKLFLIVCLGRVIRKFYFFIYTISKVRNHILSGRTGPVNMFGLREEEVTSSSEWEEEDETARFRSTPTRFLVCTGVGVPIRSGDYE